MSECHIPIIGGFPQWEFTMIAQDVQFQPLPDREALKFQTGKKGSILTFQNLLYILTLLKHEKFGVWRKNISNFQIPIEKKITYLFPCRGRCNIWTSSSKSNGHLSKLTLLDFTQFLPQLTRFSSGSRFNICFSDTQG